MIRSVSRIIIVLILIGVSIPNTFAQVVNIEKKRKGEQDGFAGALSFGFNLMDNGKNISQFKNNIDLQYKKGASTIILLNDLNLIRVDEDDLVNSGFQHLRYNYTVKDSSFLTFEAFVQHQYNTIKLMERRFLLGGGPRFRLVNREKVEFIIATLGMYEYEQRSDSLKTTLEFARIASYASITWDIRENLSFKNITYYQPAFTNFDNYRVSSETSLGLQISDALTFKIALQTTYDSNPPENVQELFYNWQNALVYKF
jgi:putative salt-induced outer membrane protein YdiY